MLKNRLFNVLIAIALVVVVALTAREASATALIVSQANASCSSLPSPYAIHTEVVRTTGTRLTYTESGPTGVDGGLMYLLSAYRACSR